jgi:hypothetical protein
MAASEAESDKRMIASMLDPKQYGIHGAPMALAILSFGTEESMSENCAPPFATITPILCQSTSP